MTDMGREAREAAKKLWLGLDPFPIMARSAFVDGYLAAAAPREQEIERLRARVVEVTAQRDAFMDSREEVVALRASLVQQAHDYRAQVVFWGENADQRTAEVASLRARVKELEGMVPRWCGVQGLDRLRALGWHVAVANWQDKPPMWLMVPPIPLPENTNNKEHND